MRSPTTTYEVRRSRSRYAGPLFRSVEYVDNVILTRHATPHVHTDDCLSDLSAAHGRPVLKCGQLDGQELAKAEGRHAPPERVSVIVPLGPSLLLRNHSP